MDMAGLRCAPPSLPMQMASLRLMLTTCIVLVKHGSLTFLLDLTSR
jgi:hypothetical protein